LIHTFQNIFFQFVVADDQIKTNNFLILENTKGNRKAGEIHHQVYYVQQDKKMRNVGVICRNPRLE